MMRSNADQGNGWFNLLSLLMQNYVVRALMAEGTVHLDLEFSC